MSDSYIKPDDWVRFYQNGKLVVGVVQYVRPDRLGASFGYQVMTDIGTIDIDSIIEFRSYVEVMLEQNNDLEL